jgi:hypothetical protein
MRLAGHVASITATINTQTYRLLIGNLERRYYRSWEGNIKMKLKERKLGMSGQDSSRLRQELVAGSCRHYNVINIKFP